MPYEYIYDIIGKILPVNCEAYLKNKGWNETGKLGKSAKIFGKTDDYGRLFEVLVPVKTSVGDFKSVLLNLLIELQNFEDRSLDYIANDIVLSKFDVFRIIAYKGDTTASLPLEDAKTLLDRSFAMMAFSAQSIKTHQPYFQSRYHNEVNTFLSKLRMGHTERGSFVLTLQTPIAPVLSISKSLFEDEPLISDEPFERQVTTRLCSLISEADTIANEPDSEILPQSTTRGMSANFLESLADITEISGESGVNLDMTWAAIRPVNPVWNIKNEFIIEKEKIEILREAGQILRTQIPEKNIEIVGFVIRLDSDDPSVSGTIKLNDITTSPQRVITTTLNDEQYRKAIDAHKLGEIVILKGDLQKSGRAQTLINISDFKIGEVNEIL
jgi:hypothetical protein